MSSKAITPIIAVILLLMMTVVAAGAAYVWMANIQASIQEKVQSNLETSFSNKMVSFTLLTASCEATPNNVTIVITNTGGSDISSGDLVLTLLSSSGSVLDTYIDNNFSGLSTSSTVSYEYTLNYDLQPDTYYSIVVAVPGGAKSSNSCRSQ